MNIRVKVIAKHVSFNYCYCIALFISREVHSTPVTDTSGNWELEPGQLNLPTAQTKETCV